MVCEWRSDYRLGLQSAKLQSTERVSRDAPETNPPRARNTTSLRLPYMWFGRRQSAARKLGTRKITWESGTTARCRTCPGSSDLSASVPSGARSNLASIGISFWKSLAVSHLLMQTTFCGSEHFFFLVVVFILPFPELIRWHMNSRFDSLPTHTGLCPSKWAQINCFYRHMQGWGGAWGTLAQFGPPL